VDLPFLIPKAIVNRETLLAGLRYVPLIPIGVWLGVWLNRRVSERLFLRLVYLFTFLTGLQLVFNFNLAKWLNEFGG